MNSENKIGSPAARIIEMVVAALSQKAHGVRKYSL